MIAFKSHIHYLFLLPFLLIIKSNCPAQGCSDAGLCTLNSMNANLLDTSGLKSNSLKFGINYGKADHAISTKGGYLEYDKIIDKKISANIKLTYLSQSGVLTKSAGLSDLFLNINYSKNKYSHFSAGIKIPLSDGNKKLNGQSLPMDYQSSLGTTDLLLGYIHQINKLKITLGIQQSLTNNKNQFLVSNYLDTILVSQFQSTNEYKREGDVLIRISYLIYKSSSIKITPSILPIYHLADDSFRNNQSVQQKIVGSKGLTFNGNLYVEYKINENNFVEFNVGSPFISRKNRPDGLTRKFIMNLEYRINF